MLCLLIRIRENRKFQFASITNNSSQLEIHLEISDTNRNYQEDNGRNQTQKRTISDEIKKAILFMKLIFINITFLQLLLNEN